jgi:DNA-binding MarR family transcriptional regulator
MSIMGSARSTQDDTSEIMQGLRRIFRAIHEYSHDVQESFGITGPQLWALRTVRAHAPISLGDLAARMCLHPSTASGVVDRLDRKGLVSRTRSGTDRRVLELRPTAEGERLLARSPEPAQGRLLHGLSRMTPAEIRAIRESIDHLVRIMEVGDLDVKFFFSDE